MFNNFEVSQYGWKHWTTLGRAVPMLSDGRYSLSVLKCPLLPGYGLHSEPAPNGFHEIIPVKDIRIVPDWYKSEEFVIIAENQDQVPQGRRQGFFFDFQVPHMAAVIMSVQRVNPRNGQPVDPRQGLPELEFPDDHHGQNFYTPNSWENGPWVDGAKVKEGEIRQFFFVDSSTRAGVQRFALPPELQDSDAIMLRFFDYTSPVAKAVAYDIPREAKTLGGTLRGSDVAAGGHMKQRVADIPQYSLHRENWWQASNWSPGPVVVIRICSTDMWAYLMSQPGQQVRGKAVASSGVPQGYPTQELLSNW